GQHLLPTLPFSRSGCILSPVERSRAMVLFKYLLLLVGTGMIGAAVALLSRDLYLISQHRQLMAQTGSSATPAPEAHWRPVLALGLLAWGPILLAMGIVIVPSGAAGVRVSQTSGTQPGTLYPGAHFVTPLAENVILFDTRDQLFTTGAFEDGKSRSAKALP